MKNGYVYVIEAVGRFKIGYTNQSIARRISQLQTGCPVALKLAYSIPSERPYTLEQQLHSRFADRRSANEWFNLNEKDCEYLATLVVDAKPVNANTAEEFPRGRFLLTVTPEITINTLGLGQRLCV